MRQAGHDLVPLLQGRQHRGPRPHLRPTRGPRHQRDPARRGGHERPRRGRREAHRARRGRGGAHLVDAPAAHGDATVQPDHRENAPRRGRRSARRRGRDDPTGTRRDDETVRSRKGVARVARGSRAGAKAGADDARRRRRRGGADSRQKEEEERDWRRDESRNARVRQGEPRRDHRRGGSRRPRSRRRRGRVPVPRVPSAIGIGPRSPLVSHVHALGVQRRAKPNAARRRRQARRCGDDDGADQGWRGYRANERRHAPARSRRGKRIVLRDRGAPRRRRDTRVRRVPTPRPRRSAHAHPSRRRRGGWRA
mmetsp:Transcript_6094/g.25253  ORF Transcript_6094/g.25253 Transcript_6094/m.25253 type:complete len:309 (+) Transcript_6094:2055-2981(+)